MKILHILAQLPSRTGSGVYFCNLIDRMSACGHQQRALFAVQGDVAFDLLDREDQYRVPFRSDALPFPVAGMSDVMPYESTVYGQMDREMLRRWHQVFRAALEQAKREFSPHVVICHHLWMLTSTAAEVFDSSVKIGVCHNTDLRQARQNPQLQEHFVTNIYLLDTVLALSDAQREEIAALYHYDPEKVVTVGAGFDEQLFYPTRHRRSDSQVRIVFAGKIDPSKGIFQLVQAFRALCRSRDNLHLDIVGAPQAGNAQRLDELIGGHPRIRLLAPMPQPELASFLRQQDIFAMPSFYEGLGLMALEALACGLFVVATEIEGLMDLLGERVNRSGAVEYVPLPRLHNTDMPLPQDLGFFTESLTEKLLRQVERVERREVIPQAVQKEIQTHSWRQIGDNILEIIHQLLPEEAPV